MALLFPAGYQFFSNAGAPLAAGTVRFYATGTTTNKAIYTNAAMSVAASNPYSLDSAGRLAVNLYGSGDYTILVKDSSAVTVFSRDDVWGYDDLAWQASGSGSVERTITAKLSESLSGADFGMVGDGSTDNKTAFDNAVAAAIAGGDSLYIPPGNYRFNSRPTIITSPVCIYGSSMSSTVLERNYNQAGASGFITIQGLGVTLRGMSINAVAGTTGGSAVEISSTASLAVSFAVIEDVSMSTYGTNTWENTLLISGTSKTSAPIGTRDLALKNVHVFGALTKAVMVSGAVGLSWHGGGIYNAGGTDGGLTITGDATVNSYYGQYSLNVISGDIVLSNCIYQTISAPVITGGVLTSSTAQYCKVRGTITGTVQNNWANSGVERSQTLHGSATFDPTSLADGAGQTTTVTVTGAALGDYVQCSFSLDLQGITVTAWVSSANTVSVRLQNESGGVLDLASGTLRVQVTKPQA